MHVVVPGDGSNTRDFGRAVNGRKITIYDKAGGKGNSEGDHPQQHGSAMHKPLIRFINDGCGVAE